MAGYDTEGDFTAVMNQANAPFGGAKGVMVKFYDGTAPDPVKTAAEGRPMYKAVEMISIIIPGDRDNIVDREVMPVDRERFAESYARYKARQEQKQEGTPLELWPGIEKVQVEELKYFKVNTVEQLAELADNVAQKIGPINALKQKARAFLAAAKDNSILSKLDHERAELKNEIQARDEMINKLSAKLEELEKRLSNRR